MQSTDGKRDVFIKTIQENEKLIFKVATFYTDSREDREDLVQEIIYNLWKSFDTFKQHSVLSTWMYRVAMNVSIYHLKKSKKKIVSMAISEDVLNLQQPENNATEDQWQSLQKHIQHLNLLDKGILMLYLENKSHEEIAGIAGISKTNVGTRLSRIKEKLHQQTSKY
ncbi:MAG: sigma-70 family RNA polymerase sigma factor [Ferruginibacter sp.]|nr:sigma-70 family RNA polymerase sigma factor [Ferruginibacter sp.]